MSKSIKDLKDLRSLRVYAYYRHSGPTDLKSTRDVFSVARTMARACPSPYVKGRRFFTAATVKETVFYRSAGALGCHTRIRAGFPRDRCMARDRPSPYVKGKRLVHRNNTHRDGRSLLREHQK